MSVSVALAGQPNCGKSTIFNMLTGARQHIANYPGVTVDKKTGSFRHDGTEVKVIDLPGTYSLTSFSLEERVARDYILGKEPDVIVNVLDSSNLKRHLYLTFQLFETGLPMVLALNMTDVAEQRGIGIDHEKLSEILGAPVVRTVGSRKKGMDDLKAEITAPEKTVSGFRLEYPKLEPYLAKLEKFITDSAVNMNASVRWFAVKILEGDPDILEQATAATGKEAELISMKEDMFTRFKTMENQSPEDYIAEVRHREAKKIADKCLIKLSEPKRSFSDIADSVVCHKILGPVIMVFVIYLLYELSIVQGYKLTNYTWPALAWLKNTASILLPEQGLYDIPYSRALGLWVVDSVNALLNYIPIFLILFGLVAFLEDVGYMPRMAFILDKLFARYGLHGQSTLPMVLGGVYVGGCAVPGIMSTKGISDERARIATILIVPLLNCLAKIPFYTLLVNIYFKQNKAFVMFFISTVTVMMAVIISKLVTMTVLRKKETTPFVMEMPPYHLPTVRGVIGRSLERVWLYIKKIITIVAAVAVVLFVLLQFPGLSTESKAKYRAQMDKAITTFQNKAAKTQYADEVADEETLASLLNYYELYKAKAMTAGSGGRDSLNASFEKKNPDFYKFIRPDADDKDAKSISSSLRRLSSARKTVQRLMKNERLDNSYLGMAGRFIEPVTKYAGFDWKVNVGILSAFAAKESMVATLGAIYGDEENVTLESSMADKAEGTTPLHALAMILFMTLYPPCIASMMMVKVQTGSYKWMLFSIFYPMALGATIAATVFTFSSAMGITGLQAMYGYYVIMVIATILIGYIKFSNDGGKT